MADAETKGGIPFKTAMWGDPELTHSLRHTTESVAIYETISSGKKNKN